MKLVRRGKVKDIYQLDDGNLLFHFSDRVSAFDVKMRTAIARKGEVLCGFGKFWFDTLGTKHHMIKMVEKEKMVVKKLTMIPLECVVRGYFYGSLVDRYYRHEVKLAAEFDPVLASRLPVPIFDPTTKSEDHDVPINKSNAISSGLVTESEYDYLERTSVSLYEKMTQICERAGFIMADVKFEFGKDERAAITLGDSLGPDESRLWLKKNYRLGKIQESYDKQLLRDWLVKTGVKDEIDRLAKNGKKPPSPEIAPDIAAELSRRYIFAYEQITGRKL